MPKQSTRHKYQTRREKSAERSRVIRILLIGALVFAVLILFRNWDKIYRYFKVYFM
ncbi:hypothetical protein [Neolewinella antarctica]|uniref:Membrane protein n=1 Tax=Neolewinella antarctica TaxID=442734 RepID=A0ABX0XFB5_9BACT|nr:hypothetical protein [Neolewinella antarctica]NJC27576.1 putative membrane protein [Neolewinella antarctica]